MELSGSLIGHLVAHYRVTARLGQGGMGVVYEARDERLARLVALKCLSDELTDDPDAARRLRREAQTIALLNHPNICTIHGVEEHEGRAFLVMERLDGSDLKAQLTHRRFSTADILEIAVQIAEALKAAHGAGVVHRDIKPGNIFIGVDGRVKVLDFGLARRVALPSAGPDHVDGSTIIGRPIGTIDYMAPERLLQLTQDPRCDLFSLGVVIYEMATARRPFTGSSPFETMTNILEHEAVPLTEVAPDRPQRLEAIVGSLIAKDPGARYPSARPLADDLVKALRREQRPLRGRVRELFRRRT